MVLRDFWQMWVCHGGDRRRWQIELLLLVGESLATHFIWFKQSEARYLRLGGQRRRSCLFLTHSFWDVLVHELRRMYTK